MRVISLNIDGKETFRGSWSFWSTASFLALEGFSFTPILTCNIIKNRQFPTYHKLHESNMANRPWHMLKWLLQRSLKRVPSTKNLFTNWANRYVILHHFGNPWRCGNQKSDIKQWSKLYCLQPEHNWAQHPLNRKKSGIEIDFISKECVYIRSSWDSAIWGNISK